MKTILCTAFGASIIAGALVLPSSTRAPSATPAEGPAELAVAARNVTVNGVVKDQNGDPVEKIKVTLAELNFGKTREGGSGGQRGGQERLNMSAAAVAAPRAAVTDKDGKFQFKNVPPATYTYEVGTQKDPRGYVRQILRITEADAKAKEPVKSIEVKLPPRRSQGSGQQ